MNEERIEWLLNEGDRLLETWRTDPAKLKLNAWQKSMLDQQLSLQHRSRTRFPDPERWLWTDRSLSQASDWLSASFKASLVPAGVPVIDACCGAGVDSVAFAASRPVTSIDCDPICARLAKRNLTAHDLVADVRECEVQLTHLPKDAWLHIDPDRRERGGGSEARRLRDGAEFSPSLDTTFDLAKHATGSIIKLAPGTELELAEDSGEDLRVWCGWSGECRQQLLLGREAVTALGKTWGGTRRPSENASRVAVLLRKWGASVSSSGSIEASFWGSANHPCAVTDEASGFLFDLDATLHAANLAGAWAMQNGLQALGNRQGFFTGPERVESPFTQVFEVLEVMGWDDRKVRRRLRQHGVGHVEVKSRLVKIDANHYQKKYSPDPSNGLSLTIVVTRIADRICAILARRLS